MDLLSLRLFVRVVELGTISKAAQLEYITPAAVSRRITELEGQFKTPLLIRSNKGVSPTPAGLELLYQAKSLLNNVSLLKERLQFYTDNKNRIIRVIANTSAIMQFLGRALGTFKTRNQEVEFYLEEGSSSKIIQALENGQADLGVFTLLPYEADIEVIPLRHDRLVLLAPERHPLGNRKSVSFAETLAYKHISLLPGSQLNYRLTKAAEKNGGNLNLHCLVSSYDAMCLLINSGVGIRILPRESINTKNLSDSVIVELTEDWVDRTIVVGMRSRQQLTAAAKQFIDFLMEQQA